MVDREDCLFLAKVAEQAERFDDMIDYMKRVARSESELTVEERNLLSLAYKNATGTLRSSLRVVAAFEQRAGGAAAEGTPASAEAEKHAKWLPEYKGKIERELRDRCNEILTLIDRNLLPVSSSAEAKVFYLKLKGDYQRYLAEFSHEAERKESSEGALVAYKAATELASAELPATNPVRLGLALNFSVFYYEVLQLPERACQMAKAAFDEAVAELDKLPEEHYKDATLIMQLLRDNLTIWTADINPDGEAAPSGGEAK